MPGPKMVLSLQQQPPRPRLVWRWLLPLLLWSWCSHHSLVMSSPCPLECTCRWKGGKETVECTGRGLSDVPPNVDAGTQVLDLSDNNLQSLPRDVFLRAKLLNLQRIYLSNCNVGQINEGAFHRLTNLIELDLSGNLLVAVPSATFKDVPGLRRLILSSNPILKIDNNAFLNLASLVTLELSRCQLDNVAPKAFHGLKGLANLRLDNNRLTTLSGKSIQPLRGLHSVDLHGNPWRCDCAMQDVKLWLTRYNIPYHKLPPICDQPARVNGQTLDQLQLDDLACPPQSLHPVRRVEAGAGGNATLACEVSSNPSPLIQWYRQGALLINLTRVSSLVPHERGALTRMYVVYERGSNTERVSVLTVTSVSEQDAGEYLCVAENRAGRTTANFTLDVVYRDAEASGLSSGQIAGISIGLLLVGGIVLLLICVLLAKWRQHSDHDGLKHPPLNQSQHKLMNSVNHVDYKGGGGGGGSNHVKSKNNSSSTGNGGVQMSFSLPRLSRSNSTQRNYSDEASDSDRTLIENLTSPSKSSTCNLSNKQPDVVVNLERNVSTAAAAASEAIGGRSRFVKDNNKKRDKKQQKAEKEKRKEKHRWGSKVDNRKQQQQQQQQHHPNNLSSTSREELDKNQRHLQDQQQQDSANNKCCNSVAAAQQCHQKGEPLTVATKSTNNQCTLPPPSTTCTTDTNRLYDDEDDDARFHGSFGNLKISSSSEWNKTVGNGSVGGVGVGGDLTIENAGFARDHMDDDAAAATQESIELIEKGWGHSLCAELKLMNNTGSNHSAGGGGGGSVGHHQQQNHQQQRVSGNISVAAPSKNNSLMINAATSPVLVTSSGGGGGGGTPVSVVVVAKTAVAPSTGNNEVNAGSDERHLVGNSCNNVAAAVKNANANAARFRHYVPVLPPLPAQHYSQVRNSLIRTCNKESAADDQITDM